MRLATLSIVSHGHGPLLYALLHDLQRQDGISNCKVVVTLNIGEEHLDPEDYPALALIIIRNELPQGFGANHNAAFSYCDSPWFVVINPDIRIESSSILMNLLRAKADHEVGLVAPRVTNSTGKVEDSVRPNLTLWSLLARRFGERKRLEPSKPSKRGTPFYWLAGMFLVVNSSAYREVEGFDTRYFLYCEDYDLCARLYLAGYSLEVWDHISVIHDAQRDSHRQSKHMRWHIRSVLQVWMSRSFWRIVALT